MHHELATLELDDLAEIENLAIERSRWRDLHIRIKGILVSAKVNTRRKITVDRVNKIMSIVTRRYPYKRAPYFHECHGHAANVLWALLSGRTRSDSAAALRRNKSKYRVYKAKLLHLGMFRRGQEDKIQYWRGTRQRKPGWYLTRQATRTPVQIRSGDLIRTASNLYPYPVWTKSGRKATYYRFIDFHSLVVVVENGQVYWVDDNGVYKGSSPRQRYSCGRDPIRGQPDKARPPRGLFITEVWRVPLPD